jgi:hypothetical protein
MKPAPAFLRLDRAEPAGDRSCGSVVVPDRRTAPPSPPRAMRITLPSSTIATRRRVSARAVRQAAVPVRLGPRPVRPGSLKTRRRTPQPASRPGRASARADLRAVTAAGPSRIRLALLVVSGCRRRIGVVGTSRTGRKRELRGAADDVRALAGIRGPRAARRLTWRTPEGVRLGSGEAELVDRGGAGSPAPRRWSSRWPWCAHQSFGPAGAIWVPRAKVQAEPPPAGWRRATRTTTSTAIGARSAHHSGALH